MSGVGGPVASGVLVDRGVVLLGPGTADHRVWSPAGYEIRYGKDLGEILERADAMIAAGQGEALLEDTDFLYCPRADVSAASFVAYYRTDPMRLLPNLIDRARKPTLFVAASEDNRMPDLSELITPHVDGRLTRMVVVEGAGHFFLDLFSDDAVGHIVAFFEEIGL